MPENFFNKIKKSFNSFIGISEDAETVVINQSDDEYNDIKTLDDNTIDKEIASEIELLPITETLKLNINENYQDFLDDFLQNDNEIISCIIFDKEDLNVQALYSKNDIDKDYIVFLLNNVSNIIVNDKINNLIKYENIDTLIDKLLIVRENNYQYISILGNTIVLMITNHKNQLITWKNIEKIKEYISS